MNYYNGVGQLAHFIRKLLCCSCGCKGRCSCKKTPSIDGAVTLKLKQFYCCHTVDEAFLEIEDPCCKTSLAYLNLRETCCFDDSPSTSELVIINSCCELDLNELVVLTTCCTNSSIVTISNPCCILNIVRISNLDSCCSTGKEMLELNLFESCCSTIPVIE